VSDNASNNDSMMVALEALFKQHGIPFNAAHARIRCLPHVIDLAATKVSIIPRSNCLLQFPNQLPDPDHAQSYQRGRSCCCKHQLPRCTQHGSGRARRSRVRGRRHGRSRAPPALIWECLGSLHDWALTTCGNSSLSSMFFMFFFLLCL
jgi:hypothetical protein